MEPSLKVRKKQQELSLLNRHSKLNTKPRMPPLWLLNTKNASIRKLELSKMKLNNLKFSNHYTMVDLKNEMKSITMLYIK